MNYIRLFENARNENLFPDAESRLKVMKFAIRNYGSVTGFEELKALKTTKAACAQLEAALKNQKPAQALSQQKKARQWSCPPIWKMGLAAGAIGLGVWALMNSQSIFILLGSLGGTLSQSSIRSMVSNPDLMRQVQGSAQTMQNWNLIADGNILQYPCSDCSDPPNGENTMLSEAALMQYTETYDGVKIWDASDESLDILFSAGKWSGQSYLPILTSLLQQKRYDFIEKKIDEGKIKGEYFISVHVPLVATYGKDPRASKILEKLFCTDQTAKEFRRQGGEDPRTVLGNFNCSHLVDSLPPRQ